MSTYDENALQALFDEVEPPASLEGSWLRPKVIRPARASGAMRAAAVVVGVLTVGGVVFGAAASDRLPGNEDDPNLTITEGPTAPPTSTTTTAESARPSSNGGAPSAADSAMPPVRGTAGRTQNPPNQTQPPPIAPARGPLTEWPDAANAGVPPGTALTAHAGDLHLKTVGTIIYNLRVDGTVFVEAPDVTLRRVQVVPRAGASAGVRQLAPRLRIEDSEITGTQPGVLQEAPGLTVQRSDISRTGTSVVLGSDTTVVDSYLRTVSTPGKSSRITLRHNAIQVIDLGETQGPVTDVTIDNNRMGGGGNVTFWAPGGPGSERIRVINNRFISSPSPPSAGWNEQASGNVWTGNVWDGTNNPVNP
jgi:hypothetical protein